jgi:putative tributyrin esterase
MASVKSGESFSSWRLLMLVFVAFASSCKSPQRGERVDVFLSADSVPTVEDVHISSQSVGGDFWYRAVVPKVAQGERLPVLYLLHGANSGPGELATQLKVRELATSARLVVVMPDGRFSYYTNAKHQRNARWEDAVTIELVQDVENRLPILKGREHRGIAGISMGGYGAIKLALKHPDLYAFAGSMSGAMDITDRPASLRRWGQTWRIWTIFGMTNHARQDEDVFALLQNASAAQTTRWFISCGETDPLLAVNKRFVNRMRAKNINLQFLSTDGGHDWGSWTVTSVELFRTAGVFLK